MQKRLKQPLTAIQEYDSAEVSERTLLVNEAAIEDGNGGNNYEVIRQSASGLILVATDNGGGTGGDGGSGGNGGNGNQHDEDTFVRLSPAYLASLATKEPCRTADQQLDVRQRYRCPVVKVSQDQAAIETAPYAIENGGLRLPEGI